MEQNKTSTIGRFNLIAAAMQYRQITLSITAMLLLAGIWAIATMPRMEDPNIVIRQGIVVAVYPGATELEVEREIAEPLEKYLFGFKEVRKEKTFSTTQMGQVIVTVQLQDWVKDKDRFWATLQHGLNSFGRQNLPPGVIGPLVNSEFGETVALMLTISAKGSNYVQLDDYLDVLEDHIKVLPKTSRIRRYGGQEAYYEIIVDNLKMRQYGIDALQVAQILQAENNINFTGELKSQLFSTPIFSNSRYRDTSELLNQIVYTDLNNNVVRLRDVAQVRRGFEDEKSFIKVKGERAVMLSVEMQPGNNIVAFGKELESKIKEARTELPANVEVHVVSSQPRVVEDKLIEFGKEFIIAILAVIFVVILLLPFRMAAISAIASPISVIITFAILNLLGYEIHQVTLAALIICLGMVVDDAIVVVDNYIEKLDHNMDRWEAAWKSASELFIPILSATATIIFSFLPLMFTLHGIPNEFVSHLPPTIAIALGCSLLVALFLTPYLCYLFIHKGLKKDTTADEKRKTVSVLDRIQRGFDRLVNLSFRFWPVTLTLAFASIGMAGWLGSKIPPEFLPIAERNQFNIELYMRAGSAVQETERAVDQIVALLEKDPRTRDVISFVGTSSPRFYATYAPEVPRTNYAQIFINTTSAHATEEMVEDYLERLDALVPNGKVRLKQLSFQDALAPVEIRITGAHIQDLQRIAADVTRILEATKGTNCIRNDYGDDYVAATLNINKDYSAQLGIDHNTLSQTLGSSLNGLPISTVWEDKTPRKIVMRLQKEDRNSVGYLQNIYLTSRTGQKITLAQLAQFIPSWHTGSIVRRNGLRTLTVRSEAQKGMVAAWVLAEAKPMLDKLILPPGVSIHFGGDDESTLENMPDLGKALGISALLIFLTLLIQFRSIIKSLIVLFSFPLSLFGAMLGLYFSGNHAGFTTFLGITSLIGIVVRNGIILVDYADALVQNYGYTPKAAAIASAQRRMRPIFLTSAAAAIGVLPMVFGGSPLWAPMGSILAMGLMFSMLMTLFTIPVLYSKLIKPAKVTRLDSTFDLG